jgi:localization factor PodJL
LKTLEASLGRLADTLYERVASVEQAQATIHNAVDEKVDEIQQQMSAVERRMDGALDRITDAASRFEMFETKAERAVGDTTWRMERALESTLTRSRAMSKELLDRVDSIEEKTREAVTNLSDTVSRITERLSRAERKSETAIGVLERSVNELDDRLDRSRPADEFAQLQTQFQKRLDSLAEDLSRPIHAVRADVERKLEEIMRSGANPEKVDKLERTLRHVQEQIQVSEARQADAVEAMSAQVERMSRAVEDRLRAVETRGDARSIEDVRREMARLADTIDARLGNTETALRNAIGRLNTSVDDRVKALEQRSASAIDAVGEQVAVVAERLQRRHDESIQKISKRLDEVAVDSRQLDSADLDRLADNLDERVKESERRSAAAIGQIGEQVARVADRLQAQHQESLRTFESRLAESGRNHEKRLAEVLGDMTRRMDEIGEHSSASLNPVHKTVSSLARRLEEIEDGPRPQPGKSGELPDEFVFLEDDAHRKPAQAVVPNDDDEQNVVGVEPPPFDRNRDAHLFEEKPAEESPASPPAEPVNKVEDLLDTDAIVLAGPAGSPEFVADLPKDDARERPAASFLEQARRAARQGSPAAVVSAGRKGIGKGPLIASAALAVAVAGGGVMTVMRGKQETKGEDFAKLDPAAPTTVEAEPGSAEAVLFGDATAAGGSLREPAATDLFDAPPSAAGTPPKAAAVPAAPQTVTLADAVAAGDPVALHDYALELLQTGEKQRAVTLLKDAAGRGLVMAEYRLA